MHLRLFKQPFTDPSRPELLRLLFEASDTAETASARCSDFYLYAWIRDRRLLHGFQAVLDEEFILEYAAPSKPDFGRIVREPFNRTIRDVRSAAKRRKMNKILSGLRNEFFPDLLEAVGKIACEESGDEVPLSGREQEVLAGLAG